MIRKGFSLLFCITILAFGSIYFLNTSINNPNSPIQSGIHSLLNKPRSTLPLTKSELYYKASSIFNKIPKDYVIKFPNNVTVNTPIATIEAKLSVDNTEYYITNLEGWVGGFQCSENDELCKSETVKEIQLSLKTIVKKDYRPILSIHSNKAGIYWLIVSDFAAALGSEHIALNSFSIYKGPVVGLNINCSSCYYKGKFSDQEVIMWKNIIESTQLEVIDIN